MKRIVEVDGQGLESLLGEEVTLFCANYIYHGVLVGVNKDDVVLKDASIVYETGPFNEVGFKDAQSLCSGEWHVRTAVIESYGVLYNKSKRYIP